MLYKKIVLKLYKERKRILRVIIYRVTEKDGRVHSGIVNYMYNVMNLLYICMYMSACSRTLGELSMFQCSII